MPSTPGPAPLFQTPSGEPQLVRCGVLFLDLLGISAMADAPLQEANQTLVHVERALRRAYRDVLAAGTPWPALLISDTLVLAVPLPPGAGEARLLGGLVDQTARVQASLVAQGLFSRGGLSVGWLHLRDGFVFGQALVKAYRLESERAVHPRVVLGEELAELLGADLEAGGTSARRRLLADRDGLVFVDYLQVLLEDPVDARPRLAAHRDEIVRALAKSARDRRVWEKFQWLADYHNAALEDAGSTDERMRVSPADTTWAFHPFPPAAA